MPSDEIALALLVEGATSTTWYDRADGPVLFSGSKTLALS